MLLKKASLLLTLYFCVAGDAHARVALPQYCGIPVSQMVDLHVKAYRRVGFTIQEKSIHQRKDTAGFSFQHRDYPGFKYTLVVQFKPTGDECIEVDTGLDQKEPKKFDPALRTKFFELAVGAHKKALSEIDKVIEGHRK